MANYTHYACVSFYRPATPPYLCVSVLLALDQNVACSSGLEAWPFIITQATIAVQINSVGVINWICNDKKDLTSGLEPRNNVLQPRTG